MKIRTDFVTNSSSSSFATVHVDDVELAKSLGYSDTGEMNDALEKAIDNWYDIYAYQPPFVGLTDLTGLLVIMALNDSDIKDFADKYRRYDGGWEYAGLYTLPESVKYKLLKRFSENHSQFFEKFTITEGDIKGLSFDIGYHDDGGYGPFTYVRISNGKRLTIVTEEAYEMDAYRGESIEGFEFLMLGKPEDYSSYEAIVEYIHNNGGTITSQLTSATRYAVFPGSHSEGTAVKSEMLESVRSECVPIVSEKAFAYRWLNADLYAEGVNFHDVIYELRSTCNYLAWFEEYGYGKVIQEKWVIDQWLRQ